MAALSALSGNVDAASRAFASRGASAAVPDLVAGVDRRSQPSLADGIVRSERWRQVRDRPCDSSRRRAQIQDAIVLAQALRIDAVANDGLIVPGQRVSVSVVVGNRGGGDVAVAAVGLLGFDGPGSCAAGVATMAAPYECAADVGVPATARLTDVYWQRPENAGRATFDADAPFGLPFRPSPFRVRLELTIAGARIARDLPVQFRYEGAGLVGEKRMELNVVPSFSVSVSPQIVVVPKRAGGTVSSAGRELRVTVINGARGPATTTVRLKTPAGWKVSPPSRAGLVHARGRGRHDALYGDSVAAVSRWRAAGDSRGR